MKNILSFLLFWMVALSVLAQPYGDAKFKQKFNKADALVFDGSYLEALPLLEEMYAFDTTNANLNYLLGVSYLLGKKDHDLAVRRLESATKDVSLQYSEANWKERKAPGLTYLYLGKAYHFKNQFDKAVSNYYNYRSYIEMDDVATYNKVRLQIQYAENAMELTKQPVGVKVTNLGPGINTKYRDYCPVVSIDGRVLIFTSRREGGTSDAKDENGDYYDDIYVCQGQPNGAWSKPQSIGSNINTAGHEAAIGLSPDGQLLFIYKDDNGDGNIYFSEKKGADWTQPQQMGSDINTTSWETHASVTAAQDKLVFVSNRSQGGYGGRDLWYCNKLPNGEWGLSLNMGSVINTQYEEESPFISADGKTLIFSSQGHSSMGGFDIFKSELEDGQWTVPENIGYPINTSEDDVFFTLTPDGRTAYYSSLMDGGFGDSDLYKLRLEVKKSNAVAVARGVMKVPAMAYADISAKIVVTDEGGAQIGTYRPNAATGYYVFILNPGESYTVSYEADGYPAVVSKVSVGEDKAYEELGSVIELKEVVFGENILALQKETERLEKEKEVAKAKAAEEDRRATEAALKAQEQAKESLLAKEKESEKEKAEELAALEKEKAAKELAAEEEKANQAKLARKEAEQAARERAVEQAKLKAAAEQEAIAQVREEQVAKKAAEQEAIAKAQEEQVAKEAAEAQAIAAAKEAELKVIEEAEKLSKAAEQARLKEKEEQEVALAEAKVKAAEAELISATEQELIAKTQTEQQTLAKAQEEEVAKAATEAQTEAIKAAELKAKSEQAALAKAEQEQANKIASEAQARANEEAEAKAKAEQEALVKSQEEQAAKEALEADARALAEAQEKELTDQQEVEAEFKAAEEALLRKQAEQQSTANAELEADSNQQQLVSENSTKVAVTESEVERAVRIAEAEKRRLELQERIQALKNQQEQKEQAIDAQPVREMSVQETEGDQQVVSVDAEAIRLKREAMLKRIEQLKNEKNDVEEKKVEDEKIVAETSERVKAALAEKTELEMKSNKKVEEISTLEKELDEIEEKVEEADVKVALAEQERMKAEKALLADKEEAKRLAAEEEQKVKEALEAERQIKELREQEEKRLAEEKNSC